MTITFDGTTTDKSPYILGRARTEHDRLAEQAAALAPVTEMLLDATGIAAGARCLDVGCGTGSVMAMLARRAGEQGDILGIDIDRALGRDAIAALQRDGHKNCRFVAGDVLEAPTDLDGNFDVVFARLVLIHADDPVAVLRRMWDLVAPSGMLIAQDYDLSTSACDPPSPVLDEFHRVVYGVFAHHNRPLDAGMRLARWFAQAGIGAPDGMTLGGIVLPMAALRPMLEGVYLSTLPLALAAGLTTAEDADRWRAELAAAPPDLTGRWPLLHGAHARKPDRA